MTTQLVAAPPTRVAGGGAGERDTCLPSAPGRPRESMSAPPGISSRSSACSWLTSRVRCAARLARRSSNNPNTVVESSTRTGVASPGSAADRRPQPGWPARLPDVVEGRYGSERPPGWPTGDGAWQAGISTASAVRVSPDTRRTGCAAEIGALMR